MSCGFSGHFEANEFRQVLVLKNLLKVGPNSCLGLNPFAACLNL